MLIEAYGKGFTDADVMHIDGEEETEGGDDYAARIVEALTND